MPPRILIRRSPPRESHLLLDELTGPALIHVARAGPESVLTLKQAPRRPSPPRNQLIPIGPVHAFRSYPQMGLLLDGQCAIELGDRLYQLRSGDWVLLPPHSRYFHAALAEPRAFRFLWLRFAERCAEALLVSYHPDQSGPSELALTHPDARFPWNPALLLEQMGVDLELDRLSSLRAKLLEVVRYFVRQLQAAQTVHQNLSDPLVLELLRWLEHEPPSRWSLPLAARTVGCSTATLNRRFRAALGCTFGSMIRERRLLEASHLLVTTSLTLAAIADRCGFSDDSHLSKVVRTAAGCTPQQYREAQRLAVAAGKEL